MTPDAHRLCCIRQYSLSDAPSDRLCPFCRTCRGAGISFGKGRDPAGSHRRAGCRAVRFVRHRCVFAERKPPCLISRKVQHETGKEANVRKIILLLLFFFRCIVILSKKEEANKNIRSSIFVRSNQT